ncbi:N-formylglutamate deformylase [Pseudotabrizicola algicola]|uniref:N-formylglutamate deformylase n=1 Tax=Pseudotabrizicola algicola TaxID=2709381 RepID=A0A6B3RTG4_9RHOB|nr:N-formylglutamate deformylase [Pseudotabrizicola algicola]NEX46352.1 N-formylglutamate deformylase [Pseudotabrizicola algicola]
MEPLVEQGDGPVILAFPHVGTGVPPEVAVRLNAEGRVLRDTDWHIHELYAGLIPGLTTVTATQSRYVIDLNRDPSGASLYPGQATTGLIPETTFDNVPIWEVPPGPADVARWLEAVHRPYHAALAAQVARVRARHGVAVVYDCHSIRSRCPWLFDGVLPDLNIGTNGGVTCAPALEAAVCRVAAASGRTWVLNGRFKGGWTTRHYGRPQEGVHAIQMELAQESHLETEAPPFALDTARAADLRRTLTEILATLADLAPRLARA